MLFIGKDADVGRDWGQEEKGTTDDEMAGCYHWLNRLEFEWIPRVGDGQGGLVCCNSWGRKESDTTEWLNWCYCKRPFLVFLLDGICFIDYLAWGFKHSNSSVCIYVEFLPCFNFYLKFQAGFTKGRGTRDQIANIHWIMEKARETSISALLTMPKPLTVWMTINCGKFFKRWECQTTWPASWETYMQIRRQQLELDMEQQTGSK